MCQVSFRTLSSTHSNCHGLSYLHRLQLWPWSSRSIDLAIRRSNEDTTSVPNSLHSAWYTYRDTYMKSIMCLEPLSVHVLVYGQYSKSRAERNAAVTHSKANRDVSPISRSCNTVWDGCSIRLHLRCRSVRRTSTNKILKKRLNPSSGWF